MSSMNYVVSGKVLRVSDSSDMLPIFFIITVQSLMKFSYCLFLLTLLFPVLPLNAQNLLLSPGSESSAIEYQSPNNGDEYVPQRTTLIVRLRKSFMGGHSAKDFFLSAQGNLSGSHSGKVVISDDDQTVIFIPEQPFAVNEHVKVNLSISGSEMSPLASYSFHTTTMTEQERGHALYLLHQQEESEIESAKTQNSNNVASSLPMNHDTVMYSPAVVVIDTAKVHEEGNIFFTAVGNIPSPYSFIAITSDTASQNSDFSNNLLFERDFPIGCGNFSMQPDGYLTYFNEFNDKFKNLGIFFGRYERLDKQLNLMDTFQCGNGFTCDEHDFHFMPKNNHAIIIAYDPQTIDMTDKSKAPCAPDTAKKNATVFGCIIQELDAQKNVVMQWRTWDHFAICDATRDINMGGLLIDPFHLNSAEIDSSDGNLIASFRNLDEVTKIDWKTGSVIWRWGGKHNMFTFSGPQPTDTLQFSHQHDPSRIPNGHITLWDNGNLHTLHSTISGKDTIITKGSTRALEYALDEANHTAKVVWEYTDLPFCLAAGNVQRLDNGNTMMGLGFVTQPSAIEVTPSGERVFQMSIQTGAFAYKTYRIPYTPPSSVHRTGNGSTFEIKGIYPNPTQNSATLAFSVAGPGFVQIEILDVLGHNVRNISEKILSAGAYSADLDLHNLSAGTYYCKLSQGGSTMTKMLVVQK